MKTNDLKTVNEQKAALEAKERECLSELIEAVYEVVKDCKMSTGQWRWISHEIDTLLTQQSRGQVVEKVKYV